MSAQRESWIMLFKQLLRAKNRYWLYCFSIPFQFLVCRFQYREKKYDYFHEMKRLIVTLQHTFCIHNSMIKIYVFLLPVILFQTAQLQFLHFEVVKSQTDITYLVSDIPGESRGKKLTMLLWPLWHKTIFVLVRIMVCLIYE